MTVSFNNPRELEKTVRSIAQQAVRPDHFFVIDSSDEELRPRMREIAEDSGGRFHWVHPEGVYAAMSQSLSIIPRYGYSWWVNSSDWLSGPESILHVKKSIANHQEQNRPLWLIGKLLRLEKKGSRLHTIGKSGKEFLSSLHRGKTGFPHPSTIFSNDELRRINAYSDGFSIASDYATALRFGANFGPPLLIDEILAVHNANGLTSQHPFRHFIEKSLARLKNLPNRRFYEPLTFVGSALSGLSRKLTTAQLPDDLAGVESSWLQ